MALDAELPATREALTAGDVSAEHAAIIAGTVSRLPEGLSAEERARVEAWLVAKARRLDPPRLRRAARRALESADRTAAEVAAHEDAELRGEEERAASRVRLTMHDNRDGTVSGHFTVPSVAGAILRRVVQQIASPRRDRGERVGRGGERVGADGGSDHSGRSGCTGHSERSGHTDRSGRSGHSGHSARRALGAGSGSLPPMDWAQRHGRAFVEILEHLPTDRLPGRMAANVVVTVDLEALRDGLGVAHLDTGHDLSAAQARRLACGAGILPAVLSGAGVPLDLGRSTRFFSERQRTALATVHDECAAVGCDRPYAWCELHHEDPWSLGGTTDLHLAVPVCGWHHRRLHDKRYGHTISDVGGRKRVMFHRRP